MTEEEEEQQPAEGGPNPTIKECIQLNQLMPIIDIEKTLMQYLQLFMITMIY